MITGRGLTKRWINDVRDTSGRIHAAHGIWTSRADLTVYVLFDDHPGIGRRAFYFETRHLKRYAFSLWRRRRKISIATARSTGAGYLFAPSLAGIFLDRVELIPPGDRDDSRCSCEIVKQQMAARGVPMRDATMAEQFAGMDLIADIVKIEVKSRQRQHRYDAVFLQVSETNPDGRS